MKASYPEGIPDKQQHSDVRDAFFAGAVVVHRMYNDQFNEPNSLIHFVEAMHKQLLAFKDEVFKRRDKTT